MNFTQNGNFRSNEVAKRLYSQMRCNLISPLLNNVKQNENNKITHTRRYICGSVITIQETDF